MNLEILGAPENYFRGKNELNNLINKYNRLIYVNIMLSWQVMDERQMQLAAKLESVQQRQAESLERREELIREMEIANQMTRRDQAKEEAARTERKQEIEAQVGG